MSDTVRRDSRTSCIPGALQQGAFGDDMKDTGKAGEAGAAQYDKAAEEFARSGRAEKAAADAEHALETDEANTLREAEDRGRAPAKNSRRK